MAVPNTEAYDFCERKTVLNRRVKHVHKSKAAVCLPHEKEQANFVHMDKNGRLSCGSPRLVALGIFGALTKLKSAANDLPYTSQVALGLFGQCNAQASKVAHC